MMRQENKIGTGTGVRTVKRFLRIFGAVLCLLAVLTGCRETDKALVFSREEPAEESEATEADGESGQPFAAGTKSAAGEVFESGTQEARESSAAVQSVCVHVCGAVLTPGVVEVPAGSRAQDALEAAGGFLPDADREYVNLASPVEDGQQLYFPTMEETERWRADMTVSRSGQILAEHVNGLTNINTADEALLCTLPGIGQARAQAIIAYREQKGSFARPEDIMKVDGIKQSAFDKISGRITVE